MWRAAQGRQRRPAVSTPGETVVIDWGTLSGGIKVFCAVVARCRFRFVRFARDEIAATTMAMARRVLRDDRRRPGEGAR